MKHKRLVSVLMLLLLTTGCTVKGWVFDAATFACKDKAGVDEIGINISVPPTVYCNDGTIIKPGEIATLRKEVAHQ